MFRTNQMNIVLLPSCLENFNEQNKPIDTFCMICIDKICVIRNFDRITTLL